jgi:hypothetical protein
MPVTERFAVEGHLVDSSILARTVELVLGVDRGDG